MTEKSSRPLVWLVDSERGALAQGREAFEGWGDVRYWEDVPGEEEWGDGPEVVFFSAEIEGGAAGERFRRLMTLAEGVPLIAVARLRSLAQAVGFFRAGAADYLSLPLDDVDARERAYANIERAATLALQRVMVELEPVGETGEISLSLHPTEEASDAGVTSPAPAVDGRFLNDDEDILAHIPSSWSGGEEEPVAVDGLAIPTLWDELPCGLLVFDSAANLVFANQLALELFGCTATNELEDSLENNRKLFDAYGLNHRPFADNQWPHVLAVKTRTQRSAIISIVRPDRRRSWLRIDCMPHLHDGQVSRLLMTAVNLTGELPPLAVPEDDGAVSTPVATPSKRKGKKKRKK